MENSISCIAPPGTGVNKSVTVTIDGLSDIENFSLFNYDGPVIVSASPLATFMEGLTTITGNNFGKNPDLVQVKIGDYICSNVTFIVDHTQFSCFLELIRRGGHMQVNVSVDGQASNTNASILISGCGDGVCDFSDENCITCHEDCGTDPCGLCGDGFCDENMENNLNCPDDCAVEVEKCPNNCSGNGICEFGVCVCHENFTGPICNTANQPINVTGNSTKPSVEVITPGKNTKIDVSITHINELNPWNVVVQSVELQKINFHLKKTIEHPQNLHVWNYTTKLENKAELELLFYHLENPGKMDFGNESLSVAQNSMKIFSVVSSWPFKSIKNSLQIVFKTTKTGQNIDDNDCNDDEDFVDQKGNLRWFKIRMGKFWFYAQFLDYAVLDKNKKSVKISKNKEEVSLTFPHFWDQAVIDPNYSILMPTEDDKNDCLTKPYLENSGGLEYWEIALACVISIVGGFIIIGGIFLFRKIKNQRDHKKKVQEKLKSLQMNTMSSTFTVAEEHESA